MFGTVTALSPAAAHASPKRAASVRSRAITLRCAAAAPRQPIPQLNNHHHSRQHQKTDDATRAECPVTDTPAGVSLPPRNALTAPTPAR
jgi:hypothetical protein